MKCFQLRSLFLAGNIQSCHYQVFKKDYFAKRLNQCAMENLQTILQSDTPVLIDCFATWCGPCKMMPPILKEVKDKFGDKIRIIKIDIDKNQSLAAQWQISSVPTMLLFKNGQLAWRQSGVVPAHQLIPVLTPML